MLFFKIVCHSRWPSWNNGINEDTFPNRYDHKCQRRNYEFFEFFELQNKMIATTEKTEIEIKAHVSNCFNILKKKKKKN